MAYDLIAYLRETFPALALGGGLFYNWPIGIHFDLGGRALTPENFAEVQRRATALFEAIFIPGDACVVISQDWPEGDTRDHGQTHLSMLADFAVNQAIGLQQPCGSLQVHELDDSETSSYTLTWFEQSARDFQNGSILTGIANADHGRFPGLCGRVYFVNPRTEYDDRGLDVIAKTKEPLAPLYREFNGWVLDYDRDRIDAIYRT